MPTRPGRGHLRCFQWFRKKQGLRVRVLAQRERGTANIRMSQDAERNHHMGQSKGSRIGDSKGTNEIEFKCKCHKCSEFGLGMYSREVSGVEASKRGLAGTRYIDMVSVDLNTLEIGAVLLLERNRKIQSGIDSCAAVTVFAPSK